MPFALLIVSGLTPSSTEPAPVSAAIVAGPPSLTIDSVPSSCTPDEAAIEPPLSRVSVAPFTIVVAPV